MGSTFWRSPTALRARIAQATNAWTNRSTALRIDPDRHVHLPVHVAEQVGGNLVEPVEHRRARVGEVARSNDHVR
jgi:hypothetical protein